ITLGDERPPALIYQLESERRLSSAPHSLGHCHRELDQWTVRCLAPLVTLAARAAQTAPLRHPSQRRYRDVISFLPHRPHTQDRKPITCWTGVRGDSNCDAASLAPRRSPLRA